jgi:hypothetical protein
MRRLLDSGTLSHFGCVLGRRRCIVLFLAAVGFGRCRYGGEILRLAQLGSDDHADQAQERQRNQQTDLGFASHGLSSLSAACRFALAK